MKDLYNLIYLVMQNTRGWSQSASFFYNIPLKSFPFIEKKLFLSLKDLYNLIYLIMHSTTGQISVYLLLLGKITWDILEDWLIIWFYMHCQYVLKKVTNQIHSAASFCDWHKIFALRVSLGLPCWYTIHLLCVNFLCGKEPMWNCPI